MKHTSEKEIQTIHQNKRLIILRIMNFINGWKRKINKVKKRRLNRCKKNVQSTLNLSGKEQYGISDTTEHVLDDNIAIESQVTLVAYKTVGKLVVFCLVFLFGSSLQVIIVVMSVFVSFK